MFIYTFDAYIGQIVFDVLKNLISRDRFFCDFIYLLFKLTRTVKVIP